MSSQKMSKGSPNAIGSQGSASGATPLERLDGQMILPFGQAPAPARVSVQAGSGEALAISVTYGPHGSGSYASAALTQSLASRLRPVTDSLGSTLFRLIWKERVTPSGRRICALRASGRHTGDKGSTLLESWPTPRVNASTESPEAADNRGARPNKNGDNLDGIAALAAWPTPMGAPTSEASHNQSSGQYRRVMMECSPWPTPNAMEGGQTSRGGKRKGEKLMGGIVRLILPLARKAKDGGTSETDGMSAPPLIESNESGNKSPKMMQVTGWPTPTQQDGEGEGQAKRAVNPERSNDLNDFVQLASWATPRMTDGTHGGPNQHGSKGDLMLPSRASLMASGPTLNGSGAETRSTGQLNPSLSRFLQGIPVEWDLAATMIERRPRRK